VAALLGDSAGAPPDRDGDQSTDGPVATDNGRPTILVRADLVGLGDAAIGALVAAGSEIYVRGRILVRVVIDHGVLRAGLRRAVGAPVIEPLGLDALRRKLAQAADWVRWDGRKKKEVPVLPPDWVGRTIMAAETWPFPSLAGVIEAPTINADGEVLDAAGYDAPSGLLYLPGADFAPVPRTPTSSELVGAHQLLIEPFHDFPFRDKKVDRAAAVAAILTVVARHAIPGPVPLFAWRAPTPGTGKTLGADVVAHIGTGHPAARTALSPKDDELRKAILAVAMEGLSCVLLDNLDGPLGSSALAAALTATSWRDRLLGVSRTVEAPLTTMWQSSGNNTVFRGDLGRRVVPIDLDAHVEHPEDRGGWRYPDLLRWVREHRAELLVAALTILRGYHVAGRPAHRCGPRKGSFEGWDDLIRGAVVWAEFGDPLAGTERIRREDDSDVAALRHALEQWGEAFLDQPTTAAEAVAAAIQKADPKGANNPSLRDALHALAPRRDKLDAVSLGYALRRVRGRIVSGRSFEAVGEERGGRTWTARRCGDVGDAS
jgi:hypothetical protein